MNKTEQSSGLSAYADSRLANDPPLRAVRAFEAIARLGATRVDVNEQNEPALGFYRHLGFAVVGRSALDGQGRPYPLLHMSIATEGTDRPVTPS